jgi:hypothetical protein
MKLMNGHSYKLGVWKAESILCWMIQIHQELKHAAPHGASANIAIDIYVFSTHSGALGHKETNKHIDPLHSRRRS